MHARDETQHQVQSLQYGTRNIATGITYIIVVRSVAADMILGNQEAIKIIMDCDHRLGIIKHLEGGAGKLLLPLGELAKVLMNRALQVQCQCCHEMHYDGEQCQRLLLKQLHPDLENTERMILDLMKIPSQF